jgi:hypothetical protein
VDRVLVFFNLVLLFFVVSIPFVTTTMAALVAAYYTFERTPTQAVEELQHDAPSDLAS